MTISRSSPRPPALSENWVGGFDATITKCRTQHQSDAFILLLGYWYGSIPPGSEKSVTHIEFESALEKWPGDFPPVASCVHAMTSCGQAAGEAGEGDPRSTGEKGFDRKAHDRQRLAFRTAVVGSWRT